MKKGLLAGPIGIGLMIYAFNAISISQSLRIDADPVHPVIGVVSAFVSGMISVLFLLIGGRDWLGRLHDWQYDRHARNLGWFEDKDEIH